MIIYAGAIDEGAENIFAESPAKPVVAAHSPAEALKADLARRPTFNAASAYEKQSRLVFGRGFAAS